MPSLTGFKEDRVGVYIEKDSFAVLDYTLDWTNWLPVDETISNVSIVVETIASDIAPLTLDLTTNTTMLTTAVLSGGTVGNIYNVAYNITTTPSTYKDSRNLRIKVVERQLA
jgi:hypothetical protein